MVVSPIIFAIVGVVALAAAIPSASFLDRLIGSGEMGRSKPVGIAFLAFAGTGLLLQMHWIAAIAMGLAFLLWRTPGFPHNTLTPTNSAERKKTFMRHAVFSLTFLVPAFLGGAPLLMLPWVAICMLWFANEATKLAVQNTKWFAEGIDNNHLVEKRRGRALGIAVAAAFLPLIACNYLDISDKDRPAQLISLFAPKV